jgi:transcriptional regulator with XRE-family HTH domain
MAARPLPVQTRRAMVDIGGHLRTWRKLLGLTGQQVSERASITRQTLARLERGDSSVGLDVFLNVARALGRLESVVDSIDPYETPFGRARAEESLPQRVRR